MSLQDAKLLTTPNAYKAGKLYSIKPLDGSGDFTASRATTATRVNENGLIESVAENVPRIDYTNGNCPSILVEGQATNLFEYSEQLDNAYWNKSNISILSNNAISPDGSMTADKIIPDAGFSNFDIFRNIGGIDGSIYTLSFFAKKAGYSYIYITDRTIGGNIAWFDIDSGSVGTKGVNAISSRIKDYNNGWYRCQMTFLQSGSNIRTTVSVSDSDNVTSFDSDGTSGVFIWGAQLEEGTEASSYIPTTSSAVTRNADVLSTTVPAGVTEIVEELEDGTTNTITNIPATYTPDPNRYKYILMQ